MGIKLSIHAAEYVYEVVSKEGSPFREAHEHVASSLNDVVNHSKLDAPSTADKPGADN
jgi:argininosuccinate lyase